jgi:hypothetical protein
LQHQPGADDIQRRSAKHAPSPQFDKQMFHWL